MNLRQKWDLKLDAEGRKRLNIFDPDMFTDEEQIEMFGEVLSGKSRQKPQEPKVDPAGLSTKLIKEMQNLPGNSRQELLNHLKLML